MVFSGYLLSSRLASCHLPSSFSVSMCRLLRKSADAEERERLKGLSRQQGTNSTRQIDQVSAFSPAGDLEILLSVREASADGHFIINNRYYNRLTRMY